MVGVSHHNSPLQVREALAFARDTLPTALVRLKREAGVSEVMILSTCNRVEVYAAGGVAEAQTIASVLRAHACARSRVPPDPRSARPGEAGGAPRLPRGRRLDSMVLGEPQILGQLKDAYQAAETADTLGPVLNALRNALRRRGQARAHGDGDRPPRRLRLLRRGRAGAEDLRRLKARAPARGRGQDVRLAAARLVRDGARATVLGGRTFATAEELAASLGGRAAGLEDLRDELTRRTS